MRIFALRIVGAAIELTISTVLENQTTTAARTSAIYNSFVTAFYASIYITEVLFTVRFRSGDYFNKPFAIETHLF